MCKKLKLNSLPTVLMDGFNIVPQVVPYGDPRPPHSMKNAFDAGEDGFGRNGNSLVSMT